MVDEVVGGTGILGEGRRLLQEIARPLVCSGRSDTVRVRRAFVAAREAGWHPEVIHTEGGGDMAQDHYDAIVVGARCAGSPTAMLLARNGYKVLVVDRATFPSNTLSTHILHPPGVAALKKWGLLDRLTASASTPE